MASSVRAKSNRSAFDSWHGSLPSGGYHSSSSAFASSISTFPARSSTFLARSSSPTRVTMHERSSSSSVRIQIDHRPTSPGRPISVQKKSNNVVSSNQKKVCMCSPTTHPGSFRCSLHKKFRYSGGAPHRQCRNMSYGSSSALNFRRSAMTNSLVRIGGVEGGDLVKRALSALIRPSSHQQRRRAAFQPKPSRLSVMSKAEA